MSVLKMAVRGKPTPEAADRTLPLDDNQVFPDALARSLKPSRYQVETATSVVEALALAQSGVIRQAVGDMNIDGRPDLPLVSSGPEREGENLPAPDDPCEPQAGPVSGRNRRQERYGHGPAQLCSASKTSSPAVSAAAAWPRRPAGPGRPASWRRFPARGRRALRGRRRCCRPRHRCTCPCSW